MTAHELAILSGASVRALQQAEALRRMSRSAEALAKKMDKLSAEITKATKGYDMAAEAARDQALSRLEALRMAEAEGLIEVVVRHKRGGEVFAASNFWSGEPT